MVTRNCLSKKDGNYDTHVFRYPRKFIFNIGDYNVSMNKTKTTYVNRKYFHISVWHDKSKVGYIDLMPSYSDTESIFLVDSKVKEDYQGFGIAYRVYEGLVYEYNIAIQSNNQSLGAIKLWRKFAKNNFLTLYFIDDSSCKLFNCNIFNVELLKGKLIGYYYNSESFDPYSKSGSLLLVSKKSDLNCTLQKYIDYRCNIDSLISHFKKKDFIKF
jgi:hypothetical protein